MTKEATITKKLIGLLKPVEELWVKKRHQSAFSTGEPDIAGVLGGLSFFIEVKRLEDGKLTPLQAESMRELTKARAYVGLYVWDKKNKIFRVIDNVPSCCEWKSAVGPVKKVVDHGFASVRMDRNEVLDRFYIHFKGLHNG